MRINSKTRQLLFDLGIALPDGPDTPIYIFPTAKRHHVWLAIQNRLWAVADIDPDQYASRVTKARDVAVGAHGLFYCSDAKSFTVPFVIESKPEEKSVNEPWPGVWHFPFQIRPLGHLGTSIKLSRAMAEWETLRGCDNPTHSTLCLSGGMAFVPSWLYKRDWERILEELTDAQTNGA